MSEAEYESGEAIGYGASPEQAAFVARLVEAGAHLFTHECHWEPDEDGCFEIAMCSDLNTHDRDYSAVDEMSEAKQFAAAIEAAGGLVVSMNDACWEGWSEYTPDPGDVRRVKVKL